MENQDATVSYESPTYDWDEIPSEWCPKLFDKAGTGISNLKIVGDIWKFKQAAPVTSNVDSVENKRWLRACTAWSNVNSDIRKEFEARDQAERAAASKNQLVASEEGQRALRRKIRAEHKALKDRADALDRDELIKFADKKPFGMSTADAKQRIAAGGTVPMGPENTEVNLYRLFDALFVGGKIDEMHYDKSRRMLVDENGVVVDDAWAGRELMDAARSVKFKGLSSSEVMKALRVWALDFKFNDITERVKSRLQEVKRDEDDERLERFLIDTFQCVDTPENRLFSQYWCLSLYNRVMNPGCRAPIAMAVFGGMDAGKSYFQKLICEELLFNPDAAPVEFDPARKFLDLYRDIYGNSIIASIPEMTNFGKADLRKMKAFMTGTTDTFDQKFGFSGPWPRQFIVVLDSNSYTGLWRDDDDVDANGESQGERRFYPIFAFEVPGSKGAIRWRVEKDLKLPYLKDGGVQFRKDLWQLMKECEVFMALHGDKGYDDVVSRTSRMVRDFSKREKDAGQGTVRDKTFDEHFPSALYRCVVNKGQIGIVNVNGQKVRGLRVLTKDIQSAYPRLTGENLHPDETQIALDFAAGEIRNGG
ncbi:VapE family protein [Paraburkholderia graminis]|uniref:VapE domain-containing protein n=1 Tax=Paraburkholderia graminis TaxID=60548 RepID=UPI0038B992F7